MLNKYNITALCITNRPQFAVNVIRQWERIGASKLIVVIDHDINLDNTLRAYNKIPKPPGSPEVLSAADECTAITWQALGLQLRIPKNKGPLGRLRNIALRAATTEYVTWLDDDDLQFEGRLEAVMALPFKPHDHILVRCPLTVIDEPTERIRYGPGLYGWLESVYRKDTVNPFMEISVGEDYYWLKQFKEGVNCSVVTVPYPLSVHIKHDSNISDVDSWARRMPEGAPEGAPWWVPALEQWRADKALWEDNQPSEVYPKILAAAGP